MINRELKEQLEAKVKTIVDEIIDKSYPLDELFDEFCDRVDSWSEKNGYHAYIRIFWYDETDLDESLNEVMEMNEDYNIEAYCNYPSAEVDGCFTVVLYKEAR